jgi:hypothetical protein
MTPRLGGLRLESLGLLYLAHKQLLGLLWIVSIQKSDNLLTFDNSNIGNITNSCLYCDGLRVYQFHNNPASLRQTHDITSGIFSRITMDCEYPRI